MSWFFKCFYISCALISFCVPEVFSLYRVPREADGATKNELYFECGEDTQIIADRFRSLGSTLTIAKRQEDPANPITTNNNPILNYTTFETKPYEANKGDKLFLLVVLEALGTTYTLAPTEPSLNNLVSPENITDKTKNIVARTTKGLIESYDVFSQCWDLTQEDRSRMAQIGNKIDTFLRGHNDRYVRYTNVYSYATDENKKLKHVPSFVQARIRAYSGGQLVDFDGNVLKDYNSATENICLPTDPNNSKCDEA